MFSEIPFVTIDSESTKDIDDAIYVEKIATGYKILVAIANPAKAVKIDSSEDMQARLIAATAYIKDRPVRRMLPVHISEEHSSLVASKQRNALVFDIWVSNDLETTSVEVFSEKITVSQRISYEDIPSILNDQAHPSSEMLIIASSLSKALLQSRRNHGALAMFDLSRLIMTDEEGNIKHLRNAEETIGNIIVQEIMILTNTLAARYMLVHDIPVVYRNHEPKLSAPKADKMAETLEGWINSRNYDEETIKQQFSAIASKANYGAHVTGHYGLNLPYYLHITSPLRRYADLVNLRQLLAFLGKDELPYDIGGLDTLANDLNVALERRKQERSDGFKVVVARTAQRAMHSGDLQKLADHELSQAIKLAAQSGEMPEVMADELTRRMNMDLLSDKLADALMMDMDGAELPESIKASFGLWLATHHAKALNLLMHATNVQFISELNISSNSQDAASFHATVSLKDRNGEYHETQAAGSKKKVAEQSAAALMVAELMGIQVATVSDKENSIRRPNPDKNYKSELQELCQKYKWPIPSFQSSGKGPSHAMVFEATVEVQCGDVAYKGQSGRAMSKKEAEALAARDVLKKLKAVDTGLSKNKPNQSSEDNPIGYIQEIAQKNEYALPEYTFEQLSLVPPMFECNLVLNFGVRKIFKGKAENKQNAKKQAAAAAVKEILTAN